MRRPSLGCLFKAWAVIVILVIIQYLAERASGDDVPLCCNGCCQSPINIDSASTFDTDVTPLYYINHFSTCGICWNIGIAGRTVIIKPNKGAIKLEGGVLRCPYILDQLHFHWGESNDNGSEHSIDGKKWAMEAHLVYYNEAFDNINEALGKPDGIAIIAIFMDAVATYQNYFLNPVTTFIYKHPCPIEPINLDKNVLRMFCDVLESQQYYIYDGSLTTKPCSENVLWFVFQKTVNVTCEEVNAFRRVIGVDGGLVTKNWRGLQMLNGRCVYNAIASNCPCPKEEPKERKTRNANHKVVQRIAPVPSS